MKKQAVIFTFLIQVLGANKKISAMFLCASVLFCSSVQAQQKALLDVNGIPLSDEVLLLLSTGTENFVQGDQANSVDSTKITSSKGSLKTNNKLAKKTKRTPNPLLEEELLDAMKAGQISRVKQLIRAGISPTFKNYKGETPLGIAVSRGWASMVISLLENGADIKEEGARGVTLLHVASSKGLTDVAKLLVKNGLNPSQKTDKNWTPLHVAARYNHWQLVQYYVSLGVDPDIRNSDGQTALGLARHLRHQGIIKILSSVTTRSSLDFAEMNQSKKKKRRKRRK